ncbi:isocitrate lyase/PEP mutase family protein [Actinomadura macrotermitis]|uniref:Isocitrate lyase/phosphoenolpyruvate mutase family protein n=1 Tax=Actinomadura macrotermitis TaxID=2585200 RepID=A0A7K0C6U7_9ACTN|nr:isocitrate lyase/phosphoenolpyruvate mutase family protein [Actinomadura macrotermitis]MQY08514.1 hypothetical protein [Actinomadura macrotermitis]
MTSFHDLHHGADPLLIPNAWDFASAAMFAQAGFAAVATTSLGVAAVAGKPDAAGATRAETAALARGLARLPVPVSIDLEDGFSADPGEVGALVAELASYGVAGVNLEDARGDAGHHAAVVRAVKEAAPGVFLNARTDTFWLGEPDLPETLRRVAAYQDAGADGVFVPGIADDADIQAVLDTARVPLNVLHLPGRTSLPRLAELGVKRVSTGSLLYRAALHAAVGTALELAGRPSLPMPSYADVERLLRP